jgi:hypothetical protein
LKATIFGGFGLSIQLPKPNLTMKLLNQVALSPSKDWWVFLTMVEWGCYISCIRMTREFLIVMRLTFYTTLVYILKHAKNWSSTWKIKHTWHRHWCVLQTWFINKMCYTWISALIMSCCNFSRDGDGIVFIGVCEWDISTQLWKWIPSRFGTVI